jgi:iron complex transport system substrate-binding protein
MALSALPTRPSRPRRTLGALVLSAGVLLAGCSSSDDDSGKDTPDDVTVTHAWGEDTYPAAPEHVVAIGTAVDNLLELGITPDAIVERPDDKNADWKNDRLTDVKRIPAPGNDLPVEAIAKENPDLIVGDYYRIDEDAYTTLRDIAPTLPGIDASADWKPQLTALGDIYGEQDRAKQVIADDSARFDKAREELPGLAGKTALIVQHRQGQFGVIADPDNASNSFFSQLGMTLPQKFADGTVPVDGGRAMVSPENVSDLAADVMGIYATESMDAIRGVAGYSALPQVRNSTVIEDDKAVMAGLNVQSSLSRAYVLDKIRPVLDKTASL